MTPPAVLFLIFNRPDKTQQVFKRIREARPAKLFIGADGPRKNRPNEVSLCNQTREIVLKQVDWPCEVQTLFNEKNLGNKLACAFAITWFFENVEEGIILEDDCLPDPSFFCFCKELLKKYRDNEQVMMICGFNAHSDKSMKDSYFFSRYGSIWGWATWQRAWQYYDLEMKDWPEYKESGVMQTFLCKKVLKKMTTNFSTCYSKNTSGWATPWIFSCWRYNGISVMPQTNLIENIGPIGVHMKPYDPNLAIPSVPIIFPLTHPKNEEINTMFDHKLEQNINRGPFKVLKLIVKYLIFCRQQKKNLLREILGIAASLYQEVKVRIKNL